MMRSLSTPRTPPAQAEIEVIRAEIAAHDAASQAELDATNAAHEAAITEMRKEIEALIAGERRSYLSLCLYASSSA